MALPHPAELYKGVQTELGLEESKLIELLGPNTRWPRASAEDGWVMSHDAIRLDLQDLNKALKAVQGSAAESGLQKWQVEHLREMIRDFVRQVTIHHDQEENVYFPAVLARIKLPDKVATDHKLLVEKLKEIEAKVAVLKGEGASAEESLAGLAALVGSVAAVDALLQEHLREEEVEMLPRIRAAFSREEMGPTIKLMHKGLKPADLGWLLRPRGSDDAKRQWLSETAIPWLVVEILMFPVVKKYGEEAQTRVDELVAGKRRGDGGGCCIQ